MNRRLITLWRIIRTGAINFVRNATLAVAAIAVMVVTLTTILVSLITNAAFNSTISQIASKINISVYLNDSVTDQQRNAFMSELRGLPEVKNVTYISKDEALAEYKAENATNQSLLQAINEAGGNPLPASIQINPFDPAKIDQIRGVLNRPSTIQIENQTAGTSYSGDRKAAIDKIAKTTDVLRRVGVVIVVLFGFVSMLIIFNTIQMAIFNRRDELTIMRLLGASTRYIRGPFVVESTIYGICAAVISVSLVDVVFILSSSALQATSLGLLDIGYADAYFHRHFWLLLTGQLLIGIVIGVVSSVIATRRYLKFKSVK
ncbi:MAG TPA: permease-like cell division protein FtsX [Candidatus Saccharimonadales bacterium]|nr:permease-like cell division protein FtsX [Candidatus Saccharimonadales bacterium]